MIPLKKVVSGLVVVSLVYVESAKADHPAEQLLDEAIYACMQGQSELAFARFDQVIETYSPPEGIMGLITFYKASQCRPHLPDASAKARSKLRLETALGYSSNINQGIAQNTLVLDGIKSSPTLVLSRAMRPKADDFVQVSLDYQQTAWQAMLNLKHYSQYNEYQLGNAYLAYTGEHLGVSLSRHLLGNVDYLQETSLAVFDHASDGTWQWGVKLRQQTYIQSAQYNGKQIEPFVYYTRPQWKNYVALLLDHADGQRLGGNKQGVMMYTQYQTEVAKGSLSTMLYYHRLYDSQVYSPDLLNTIRLHQLIWLRLRYAYPIDQGQQVYLELSRLHSDDRLSLYRYDVDQVMLGWQYQW